MTATQAFRLHARAFAAGAVVLTVANWFTGAPWWSFWPLAGWGIVLAGHYLFQKTRTVNEAWVEERAADVHSKSYDAGHIDRIADDQKDPKP